MSGLTDEEFDEILLEVDRAVERARIALDGRFSKTYRELRALSPEEIDSITPDTTDQEEYERLMALVQEASRTNMSQAQLVERIRQLGGTAVEIAKKVNSLAGLL